MIPRAIPQPPSDATIEEDMLCITCGYDLRGLKLNQLCPECATPTARSKLGNFLHFAHPEWLGKVRLGIALMLWYLLATFISQAGAGIAAVLSVAAIGHVLIIGTAVLNLGAVFLVTSQEPRISLQEDPMTLRNFVRGCALAEFIGVILQTIGDGALFIAGSALGIIGIAKFFGIYVYLRRFALRIPDHKLAKQTRIVMWGMAISYGALAVGGGVAAVAFYMNTGNVSGNVNVGTGSLNFNMQNSPPGNAAAPANPGAQNTAPGAGPGFGLIAAMCLAIPGGLAVLVFSIWSIVLLFYYLGAFKRAKVAAETHHAQGTPEH